MLSPNKLKTIKNMIAEETDHDIKGRIAARILFPDEDNFFKEQSLEANTVADIRSYLENLARIVAKELGTKSLKFQNGFVASILMRWSRAKNRLPAEMEKTRTLALTWRAENFVKQANRQIVEHETGIVEDPHHAMDWSDSTMRAVAERKVGKIVLELLRELRDPESQHIVHISEVEERIVRWALKAGSAVSASSSMSRTSLRIEEAQAWSYVGQLAFDQLTDS